MNNDLKSTIRLRRPVDSAGDSNAANDPPGTEEFELVSTQMLEQILFDMNDVPREADQIREIAESDEEGWLARDATGSSFEIVKDDELEAALRSANDDSNSPQLPDTNFEQVESLKETANGLCLVSTQHLRRVLDGGTGEDSDVADKMDEDVNAFDPYNSN
ncbi:MAG: hypothetical protein AAFX10_14100 [Pseudomonadota bacterium]